MDVARIWPGKAAVPLVVEISWLFRPVLLGDTFFESNKTPITRFMDNIAKFIREKVYCSNDVKGTFILCKECNFSTKKDRMIILRNDGHVGTAKSFETISAVPHEFSLSWNGNRASGNVKYECLFSY